MTRSRPDVDVAVIGAGLSGLASALLLAEAGIDVAVLEASGQAGGRIRSVYDEDCHTYVGDFGPTWIWPSYQPTVKRWIEKLSLDTFDQFSDGLAVLDYGADRSPELCQLPTQHGHARIVGGPQALIDALTGRLSSQCLQTRSPVGHISFDDDGACLRLRGDGPNSLSCSHVIVATPPRVANRSIDWTPVLPEPLASALAATPTWMAPHAKVVAIYEYPFWRDRGLSGRIASHVGPIVEGHDHCGPHGTPAALFGFLGWSHEMRAEHAADLRQHVADQLERCFGPNCPAPTQIYIHDWAREPFIVSPFDLTGTMAHPTIGPDILRRDHFNGRLHFAGAETALQSPGLIDGALSAAEQIAQNITARIAS